jgi:hypothetical protein
LDAATGNQGICIGGERLRRHRLDLSDLVSTHCERQQIVAFHEQSRRLAAQRGTESLQLVDRRRMWCEGHDGV